MKMDQIKTTKDPPLSISCKEKNLLFPMVVTLDTTQLLRSVLNKEARLKAIVFERRKKKGKM